ncbi:alpha/beta hydrolase fold domain-containing protein [Jannaschia sp. CCS1]|uniref:alpha/beta hydrolase fold domain-containing protein n=1 Tax=Jannaschia sp. (strain CCS1) TaxID=290400 RepID=UPI000053C22F|nr:alpha/beta hydrolase [Jannaschia sp. CCS1]ABD55583.1 Alpha/beta hydrolase fold-3 [Jannaschia sp. CCS1]
MSVLTRADRISTWTARRIEKPLLSMIGSQQMLRALFNATAPLTQRLPQGCIVADDGEGGLFLTPEGAENAGLFLYIHGGGFTIGSPRTHRAMAAHIGAEAGLRVHLPRYSLAPEAPFPAAITRLKQVYAAHVARGDTPVAVGGDSAGGNLALLLTQNAVAHQLPLPRAMVLLAPVVDFSRDIAAEVANAPSENLLPAAWARRVKHAYTPEGVDLSDPKVSPMFGDLQSLPPTLMHLATGEALADQCKTMAAQMPDCRVDEWPGLQHVWHLKAGVMPAATQACAELGAFLRTHT